MIHFLFSAAIAAGCGFALFFIFFAFLSAYLKHLHAWRYPEGEGDPDVPDDDDWPTIDIHDYDAFGRPNY